MVIEGLLVNTPHVDMVIEGLLVTTPHIDVVIEGLLVTTPHIDVVSERLHDVLLKSHNHVPIERHVHALVGDHVLVLAQGFIDLVVEGCCSSCGPIATDSFKVVMEGRIASYKQQSSIPGSQSASNN